MIGVGFPSAWQLNDTLIPSVANVSALLASSTMFGGTIIYGLLIMVYVILRFFLIWKYAKLMNLYLITDDIDMTRYGNLWWTSVNLANVFSSIRFFNIFNRQNVRIPTIRSNRQPFVLGYNHRMDGQRPFVCMQPCNL